ncbi:hypothetical protein T11_96 [Trichinella zimbabwensis]|uniref:Uncharacterized protein n=1 Tax=Trichinella zimbabwensis TaxID=268475 RepID=A0A0V1GR59_9BILA|nr:hypothetical protein T11_10329 [Trichinella zimbabwensis]KRZ00570.1 hypothetical protein T11_96 [Trichinella zimbabwensis]
MSGPVDQSGAIVWNRRTRAAVDQSPDRSASFPLPVWLSRYHYCYGGVEPHKRKRPCTEPAVPQHTYTLESKIGFIFLAVLKSANNEIRKC